jgi:catechol 2,3-dioxygenase-like lactoylglutathione lyase family enzyme
MFIKDSNLTLMIKDMEASIVFYTALGFTLKNRLGNHYAQLTSPGLILGLHPYDTDKTTINSGNASIGFTTDDIDKAREHLENLNIPLQIRIEEGGHFLHFADPDGTSLYFIQPKWS